ncbi:MAG: CRTAC1 family protein [Gemmataceae bacterium]|nr:CRTAC1 family protein [Gemmataceae bacterium]
MCNRLVAGFIAAVTLATITGCPSRVKEGPPKVDVKPGPTTSGPSWFRDVAAQAGLQFTYKNGEKADQFTILEILGGGVALIDYDGDGLLDIFVTGGGTFDGPDNKDIKGHPCKLYKNLGAWKFRDVTAEVGLDGVAWWYTHGVAVADYDCDGFPDLLVTGYGQMKLFHNDPVPDDKEGRRRFVDVTEKVGLRNDSWSTSAGWADLDGDGFPDLYVCHYVDWSFANNPLCKGNSLGVKRDTCPPEKFKPLVHTLFRNEKGKSFRNVSAEHGFKAAGCGLGVILADLNDDGKPDIYVANDTNKNFLFMNRGDGKFEERAQLAGVATDEAGKPEGSMGVDAGDYDGSGRASLWVTNFQGELHALYLNLGRESFHHQSCAAGTAALGQQWVGFGTGFLDVDNDGWEDLVIANGHVWRYPVAGTPKQRPILMQNTAHGGKRFFKDISPQGGDFFQTPALGRGIAIGDLDNDGWPDVVFSHTNSPVALLRNEAAAGMKPPHRWLGVKLVRPNHRDAVGSTVILEGNTRKLTRFAKGGGSYLSANDSRILFGLGAAEQIKRVTVKWAWGQTQTWENLEPNQYWELHEGQPNATSPRKR